VVADWGRIGPAAARGAQSGGGWEPQSQNDLDRGAGARYLPAPVKAFLDNSFGCF